MMGRALCAAGALAALLPLVPWAQIDSPQTDAQALRPEVEQFVSHMAQAHGFDPAELRRLLAQIKPSQGVQRAIAAPSTAKPWHEFRPLFVDQSRIDNGVKFWEAHAETLARARAEFGVPESVIVSIIGIETRYGRFTGGFKTLDALYTLAFEEERRQEYFRGELEQFLVLAREQRWEAASIAGSFAGALGLPQFMPTSYRRYAIDYNADGVIDLWRTPADAIGSVGSYLKQFGWRDGEPVVAPVRVETTESEALLAMGLKPALSVEEWRARGVQPMGDAPAASAAALFRLDLLGGAEYWFGFDNFWALLQYNRSRNYAMAVHQLAQELSRERARLVAVEQAAPGGQVTDSAPR
jgi:membrane-bound lytic murein transglycosylase B